MILQQKRLQFESNWLLPADWNVLPIKAIAEKLKAGGTPKRGIPKYYGGDIPFVKIEDITNASTYIKSTNETITNEGLVASSAWIVPNNSVLLAMYGSIGKVAITSVPVATNQAIIAIVPKPHVFHEYLYYSLLYFGKELSKYNIQSTQKNINKGIVERFTIPLPPLPEQRAIAHVLTTVRQAIEATERVIAAARELKRSLMKYLFTYGPVPIDQADQVPIKDTILGSIPSHWIVDRLENYYEIQQGKALSQKYREGKSPSYFLRTANVLWGKLDLSLLDQMDFTDSERDKLRLRKEDLLICEGGEIGRTAIWNEEVSDCYFQNHIFRVRAKSEDVYPQFHMYWMNVAILLLGHYQGYGNKTTIPNLSKQRLSSFPIPIPPIVEQRTIAEILNNVDHEIEMNINYKKTIEQLFSTLLHHLMTGKIRVAPEEFGLERN